MADIDKQELRKLAESQAQEPWFKSGEIMYHDKRTGETHGIHHDDDAFIVAASPATVLALLDEIDSLSQFKSAYLVWLDKSEWVQKTAQAKELGMHRADVMTSRVAKAEVECEQLRAEVEALRKDKARLDWLDAKSSPLRMGWRIGIAPAGNASLQSVVELGEQLTPIRDAIDRVMTRGVRTDG